MAQKKDPRLTKDQSRLIDRARKLGPAKTGIRLDDASMARVIGFIERDLATPGALSALPDEIRPEGAYFATDPTFGNMPEARRIDLPEIYLQASEEIQDFERAFECLCEIHKRRVKYARIQATQPLPAIADIAHRGMLEFGLAGPASIASLMRLRKFQYDLDNRAAQESAYLFNKIIAHALGGRPHSAATSPIRRLEDNFKKRNVDCIIGERAYDFKGRMTEAASRRARYNDELMFPRDCRFSGYTPVLLALYQLPGDRSEGLIDAYERNGGEAHIGPDAWRHLRECAGPMMSNFIDTYVLTKVDALEAQADQPMDMTVRMRTGYIEYEMSNADGGSETVRMPRAALCE